MSGGEIVGDEACGEIPVDDPGHTQEQACLNCGTALLGTHCHACGQAAHVHRTLASFFHDLLHGVFHFEGKIWRTFPMLAWQPGKLTREYIDGRRARYVSPIALFLFSVFLLFAAIHAVEGGSPARLDPVPTGAANAAKGNVTFRVKGLDGTDTSQNVGFRSDVPAHDRLLKEGMKNPQLALLKVQSAAYKYSWALIPLSVPFIWLLFPFSRRFGVYDHTVFVTYSLAFMSVLAVILTVGAMYNVPFVAVLLLIPPVHLYRQLKGTYALSRGGALWRTAAVLAIAATASTAFAVLILALGLSG